MISRSTAASTPIASGGQLSVGQAGAGGAYLGVVEALRQVLGQAGPNAG